jgi:hypothetical protein
LDLQLPVNPTALNNAYVGRPVYQLCHGQANLPRALSRLPFGNRPGKQASNNQRFPQFGDFKTYGTGF